MKKEDTRNNHSTHLTISKIATVFIVFLCILLGLSVLRNLGTILSTNKEIALARQKLSEIEAKNKELEKQKLIVESPSYKEKLIRDQLGFAKEGETVLILPDNEILEKLSPIIAQDESEEAKVYNWQKWLKLLF
jgi:cell division protein FtsB